MTQTSKPYLILVAVDYSMLSEQTLQRALELTAEHPNAELHVVHVVSALDTPPIHTEDGADHGLPSIDRVSYRQLQSYVATSVGAFEKRRNGTPAKPMKVVAHVRTDAPSLEISQLAADLEADVIVIGMCGRSAVRQYFLGSVAEGVSGLAPCPVLVFRPKGIHLEIAGIEAPSLSRADTPNSCEEIPGGCGRYEQHEQHEHRAPHGQRNAHHYTVGRRRARGFQLPFGPTAVAADPKLWVNRKW